MKHNPLPSRVKPIPFPIIALAMALCHCSNTLASNRIVDMLLLGFFILLHTGEYAYMPNPELDPFRLCDVHLLIQDRGIHPLTATEAELHTLNYIALEFTMQKQALEN
jgi:hypothetical protein